MIRLKGDVAGLKQVVDEQRAEIARLKGRPAVKPSGMAQAMEPRPPGRGRSAAVATTSTRVDVEKQKLKAEAPAGSRFKSYETCTKGPFWSMPSMLLSGTATAAGIAWINSIGNVGGAIGPALVGWLKDTTGSYSGGLYGLAVFIAIAGLIALFALNILSAKQRAAEVAAAG